MWRYDGTVAFCVNLFIDKGLAVPSAILAMVHSRYQALIAALLYSTVPLGHSRSGTVRLIVQQLFKTLV